MKKADKYPLAREASLFVCHTKVNVQGDKGHLLFGAGDAWVELR